MLGFLERILVGGAIGLAGGWLLSRILRDPNDPLDDVLRHVLGSADFHEGRRAFVEKRRPIWRNA